MTDEPEDQKPLSHIAHDALEAMAGRIAANFGNDFGGCFVIVPPKGELIEMLVIAKPNPAMFFGNLKALCDIKLAELEEEERRENMARGYGGR